jgi:hypothetical protein
MHGYKGIIESGWKTGVHDCRACGYQHPWLAVHRESGSVVGCHTRAEAKDILRRLKAGVPAEAIR